MTPASPRTMTSHGDRPHQPVRSHARLVGAMATPPCAFTMHLWTLFQIAMSWEEEEFVRAVTTSQVCWSTLEEGVRVTV